MPDLFTDPTGLPRVPRAGEGKPYVPYEIESLTVKRSRVPRSGMTTAVCRVKGWQADDFITGMVGRAYVDGGILHRTLPESSPSDPRQYCTRCEQVDQGGDGLGGAGGPGLDPAHGWPVPKWVRFRVTFEGLAHRVETDEFVAAAADEPELYRYVERSWRPRAKEQQLPGGGFKIVGTTDRIGIVGFKRVIMADVQYVWRRVPVASLPIGVVFAALGHFNDATFDAGPVGGYTFNEETLLFTGFDDSDKYWDANGDWVCDVVYSFEYRNYGWNRFLNNVGAPVEVSSDGTGGGTKPYTGADFNALFRIS